MERRVLQQLDAAIAALERGTRADEKQAAGRLAERWDRVLELTLAPELASGSGRNS